MSQSLFSSVRDSSLLNQSVSFFSTPSPSPLLSSTPLKIPNTQEFADQLVGLRAIDFGPDPLKQENAELKSQLEDAKSELVALRLQLEENENEILRLRQQQPPSSLQAPNPPPPPNPPPNPPPLPPYGYRPVTSRRTRQRQNKAAKAAAAAASTSATAASTSAAATSTSAVAAPTSAAAAPTSAAAAASSISATTSQPPPPLTSLKTVHVFHDSNLKGISKDHLKSAINHLSTDNNNDDYNITLHDTYCLHPTLKQIRQMTFKRNDIVVLNIMTNDARPTPHRPKRTPTETTRLLSSILNLLLTQLPRSNIVVLEAPPHLYNDIYPYNVAAHHLALQNGVRFGQTLIGEEHMEQFDGFHIKKAAKTLLVKTISAAVCDLNPHLHFSLHRPPHGIYGPWVAPAGVGVMPFSKMAMSSPINFRRSNWRRPEIRPLMSVKIRSH